MAEGQGKLAHSGIHHLGPRVRGFYFYSLMTDVLSLGKVFFFFFFLKEKILPQQLLDVRKESGLAALTSHGLHFKNIF